MLDARATAAVEGVARRLTAQVQRSRFVNFSVQRNRALALAHGAWVLFLDPDERVTPALAREIPAMLAAPGDPPATGCRGAPSCSATRCATPAGGPTTRCACLRRDLAHYDEGRAVHEVPLIPRSARPGCRAPLIHYNYATWRQFTAKQRAYARHEAQAQHAPGRMRARPRNFVLQPLREFRRRYITLAGWKDGPLGLLLALAMAYYTFQMYRALARLRGPSSPGAAYSPATSPIQ